MTKTIPALVFAISFAASPTATFAQDTNQTEPAHDVQFGAFLDTYYAYDWNQHGERKRPYTTQAWYHDDPSVNLAFVEAKLSNDNYRGRLALQAGSSVDANYSAEPKEVFQYIQEATVGTHLTDKLWLDAGIHFSHLGLESWISSDNWTYTRSLIAEYSPYYQLGAKATYAVDDSLSLMLLMLNGWQNISDDRNPAFGMQLAYTPTKTFLLSYSNYLSNEKDFGTRFFNDFVLKTGITEKWELAGAADIGFQELAEGEGSTMWNGFSLITRYHLNDKTSLSGRIERFFDPSEVVLQSLYEKRFSAWGTSLNVDHQYSPEILLRAEYRVLFDDSAIFPKRESFTDSDPLFVVSVVVRV